MAKKTNEQLEAELAEALAKIAALTADTSLAEALAKIGTLNGDLTAAEAEIKRLRDSQASLAADNGRLRDACEDLRSRIEELEELNEDLGDASAAFPEAANQQRRLWRVGQLFARADRHDAVARPRVE